MKETKKAILDILQKDGKSVKKGGKFESLVLNLALQKIDSESFEFDGEAVYTINRKCLIYCLSNKECFVVPEGVETIGEMAFRSKKQLKSVVLASTVKDIGKDAFYDCDRLDNVFIPKSVDTIKSYAFAECDSLKTVIFEGAVEHLSRHAFSDSDNLHRIVIPKGTLKKFQKALHYDSSDDYVLLEKEEKTDDEGTSKAKKGKTANDAPKQKPAPEKNTDKATDKPEQVEHQPEAKPQQEQPAEKKQEAKPKGKSNKK